MKLDRCVGSCSTLNDFSYKVCFPNKKADLNLSVFKMNTEINELKTLTKHVYAHVNINLMVENVIPIKSGIMINVGKKCMSVKNILYMKRLSLV